MEYTIKFSQQELQTVLTGLGELPLKLAIGVVGRIQQEVIKQDGEQAIAVDSPSK